MHPIHILKMTGLITFVGCKVSLPHALLSNGYAEQIRINVS
jgi:hypothetical protein